MATEHAPKRGDHGRPVVEVLAECVDPASFVVFRVGFGLLAAAAALRFMARGWVDSLLVAPAFHFAWVPGLAVSTRPVLYLLFGVQVVGGVALAVGRWPRTGVLLWLLSFGYVELLDKALYLNHYVLMSLWGLWLLGLPVHRVGSAGEGMPRFCLWLLRLQVASVYLWAGVAKLNVDWLLGAEPLRTWLGARADVPLVGPWLAQPQTAYAMAWAGAAFDLTVPFLLLWPRTRVAAMCAVLAFHATVGLLFPIGVFPWLMVLSATLLLSPSWPRRWLRLVTFQPAAGPTPSTTWLRASAVGVLALLVVCWPARFLLSGTEVNWSERGFRFAWRVMLVEKTGMVDYRVLEPASGRVWRVMPSAELTPLQHKQMRTQPDMIRDYALHLREQHAAQGRAVEVYADAWASLHGRPAQRLIDPRVDLTQPEAVLERAGWIVPLRTRTLRSAMRRDGPAAPFAGRRGAPDSGADLL